MKLPRGGRVSLRAVRLSFSTRESPGVGLISRLRRPRLWRVLGGQDGTVEVASRVGRVPVRSEECGRLECGADVVVDDD